MKNYEAIFVLKPETDDNVSKVIASVTEVVRKNKGKVLKEENWGKRPIAYEIKKEKDGVYYKLEFSSDPLEIKNMENAYRLNPKILRVMIIKREAKKK